MSMKKKKIKILTFVHESDFEVFPSIYIWWKPDIGVAFSWLIWSLEVRKNNPL